MKKGLNLVAIVLALSLIVLSVILTKANHNYSEQLSVNNSLRDSVKYFKNKNGEYVSQIIVLQGSTKNLLTAIDDRDAVVSKLLKNKSKAASAFNYSAKVDTVTLIKKDTVDNSEMYSSSIHGKWIDLDIKAKNDSLHTTLELRDEVTVAFRNVSNGFLKPKKLVAEVTNRNPYVKITGLRSFYVPQKKSRFNFWLGVGAGVAGSYLLIK